MNLQKDLKVKIFDENSSSELESSINKWLSENSVDIYKIMYQHSPWQFSSQDYGTFYTCLIFYR